MDHIEIENLINIVSYGATEMFCQIDNKSHLFILHSPTQQDKYRSTQIYNKEFSKAILNGLKKDDELLQEYINANLWTVEKNQKIETIKKDIHKIKRGLLDFLFQKEKLQRIKQYLRKLEFELITILDEKQKLISGSANNHALMCQQRFIISRVVRTENNEMVWPTHKDFEDEKNLNFINELTLSFFQTSKISVSKIRELARSNTWRSTWSVAKSISNLFEHSITRWSSNQSDLVYWSQIYDMVYESYERPKQEIVEDDDLLDSWLIRQNEKSQSDSKSGLDHGESKHQFKKQGRQEQFVMADKEGAKEIYSMNNPGDRQKIIKKQSIIQNKGSVKEQDMPDSQMEMKLIAADQRKAKIKDVRKR